MPTGLDSRPTFSCSHPRSSTRCRTPSEIHDRHVAERLYSRQVILCEPGLATPSGLPVASQRVERADVGPVQGRNPLGLRFLRRFRLARTVEGDRLANERLEGGPVDFFSFVDVDRA